MFAVHRQRCAEISKRCAVQLAVWRERVKEPAISVSAGVCALSSSSSSSNIIRKADRLYRFFRVATAAAAAAADSDVKISFIYHHSA